MIGTRWVIMAVATGGGAFLLLTSGQGKTATRTEEKSSSVEVAVDRPGAPGQTGAGSLTGDPVSRHAPVDPKPQAAPVLVEAVTGIGGGVVTVTFLAVADDVTITLRGAGGLRVTSDARPVQGRSFATGEKIDVNVDFVAGPDLSHLGVKVDGKFRGRRMQCLIPVGVGTPAPSPKVKLDFRGERIHELGQ